MHAAFKRRGMCLWTSSSPSAHRCKITANTIERKPIENSRDSGDRFSSTTKHTQLREIGEVFERASATWFITHRCHGCWCQGTTTATLQRRVQRPLQQRDLPLQLRLRRRMRRGVPQAQVSRTAFPSAGVSQVPTLLAMAQWLPLAHRPLSLFLSALEPAALLLSCEWVCMTHLLKSMCASENTQMLCRLWDRSRCRAAS